MTTSHRFPTLKFKKDVLDIDYLLFFKSEKGKHLLDLASHDGAGYNKTLGQSDFAKLQIPVPSLEEQRKVASVLSEADKEIDLLRQHIKVLKEQKKRLMQKLLMRN
ncbi:MAG: restriction endonuclease subunit S [Cyclobacteriaceae bacterium]